MISKSTGTAGSVTRPPGPKGSGSPGTATAGSGTSGVAGAGTGPGRDTGTSSRSSIRDGDGSAGGASTTGSSAPTSATAVCSGPVTAAYTSEAGCCCARASPAARTKAPPDRTSTTKRARVFRLRRPGRPVILCGCPSDKSLAFRSLRWRYSPKRSGPHEPVRHGRTKLTPVSLPPDVVRCQHFSRISRGKAVSCSAIYRYPVRETPARHQTPANRFLSTLFAGFGVRVTSASGFRGGDRSGHGSGRADHGHQGRALQPDQRPLPCPARSRHLHRVRPRRRGLPGTGGSPSSSARRG